MEVCATFYGNPFNSFQEISFKIIKVNLMVALEVRDDQVIKIYLPGFMNACTKAHVIHPIEVEIF